MARNGLYLHVVQSVQEIIPFTGQGSRGANFSPR